MCRPFAGVAETGNQVCVCFRRSINSAIQAAVMIVLAQSIGSMRICCMKAKPLTVSTDMAMATSDTDGLSRYFYLCSIFLQGGNSATPANGRHLAWRIFRHCSVVLNRNNKL